MGFLIQANYCTGGYWHLGKGFKISTTKKNKKFSNFTRRVMKGVKKGMKQSPVIYTLGKQRGLLVSECQESGSGHQGMEKAERVNGKPLN